MGCCGGRGSLQSPGIDSRAKTQADAIWAHEEKLRQKDSAHQSPLIKVCITDPPQLQRPVLQVKAMETVASLLERITVEVLELDAHHYARLQLRVAGCIFGNDPEHTPGPYHRDYSTPLDAAVSQFAEVRLLLPTTLKSNSVCVCQPAEGAPTTRRETQVAALPIRGSQQNSGRLT